MFDRAASPSQLKLISEEPSFDPDTDFVERILNHKGPPAKLLFPVRWKSYDSSHDSWEPKKNFIDPSIHAWLLVSTFNSRSNLLTSTIRRLLTPSITAPALEGVVSCPLPLHLPSLLQWMWLLCLPCPTPPQARAIVFPDRVPDRLSRPFRTLPSIQIHV